MAVNPNFAYTDMKTEDVVDVIAFLHSFAFGYASILGPDGQAYTVTDKMKNHLLGTVTLLGTHFNLTPDQYMAILERDTGKGGNA